MPKFTIETTYMLPVYRHTTYEAPTLDAACQQAMADDNWEHSKDCYNGSGPEHLTGAWEGEDNAYGPGALAIPEGYGEEILAKPARATRIPMAQDKVRVWVDTSCCDAEEREVAIPAGSRLWTVLDVRILPFPQGLQFQLDPGDGLAPAYFDEMDLVDGCYPFAVEG